MLTYVSVSILSGGFRLFRDIVFCQLHSTRSGRTLLLKWGTRSLLPLPGPGILAKMFFLLALVYFVFRGVGDATAPIFSVSCIWVFEAFCP